MSICSALMLLAATLTPASVMLDDFEAGDGRARSGLGWIAIADDLMGGASFADLRVTAPGARSAHALRVTGEVAAGGFAGAWVALDDRARPVDVTDFEGVRLLLRGRGAFQLALRAGPGGGSNYVAPIEADADWTQVTVPFTRLRAAKEGGAALDLHAVRWLGLTTSRAGRYQVDVDDVEIYSSRAAAHLRPQDAPTFSLRFDASALAEAPPGPWRDLARDAQGDGKQKALPDATALASCADPAHDRLWFRILLAAPLSKRWFGVNLALDVDGDPGNGMAWWGTNAAFHFDRLVTVYGFAAGPGYQGMIGIADAAEVQAGNMFGSRGERVLVVLDSAKPAILVGIPRGAVGDGKGPVRLVAAVGSAMQHNDDVPDEGAVRLSASQAP